VLENDLPSASARHRPITDCCGLRCRGDRRAVAKAERWRVRQGSRPVVQKAVRSDGSLHNTLASSGASEMLCRQTRRTHPGRPFNTPSPRLDWSRPDLSFSSGCGLPSASHGLSTDSARTQASSRSTWLSGCNAAVLDSHEPPRGLSRCTERSAFNMQTATLASDSMRETETCAQTRRGAR